MSAHSHRGGVKRTAKNPAVPVICASCGRTIKGSPDELRYGRYHVRRHNKPDGTGGCLGDRRTDHRPAPTEETTP